jgi:hypothetical protein
MCELMPENNRPDEVPRRIPDKLREGGSNAGSARNRSIFIFQFAIFIFQYRHLASGRTRYRKVLQIENCKMKIANWGHSKMRALCAHSPKKGPTMG